jgi:hypothetical protein
MNPDLARNPFVQHHRHAGKDLDPEKTMKHFQDANEQQCQQLEFDFENKGDDPNNESQSPHDDRCPDCGHPVDQRVLTLMEVLPSVLKQLEEIQRRLEPLERDYFEQKHRAKLEAGYGCIEARLGDG